MVLVFWALPKPSGQLTTVKASQSPKLNLELGPLWTDCLNQVMVPSHQVPCMPMRASQLPLNVACSSEIGVGPAEHLPGTGWLQATSRAPGCTSCGSSPGFLSCRHGLRPGPSSCVPAGVQALGPVCGHLQSRGPGATGLGKYSPSLAARKVRWPQRWTAFSLTGPELCCWC